MAKKDKTDLVERSVFNLTREYLAGFISLEDLKHEFSKLEDHENFVLEDMKSHSEIVTKWEAYQMSFGLNKEDYLSLKRRLIDLTHLKNK